MKKPERFTEKIQYYKLYCREEMMTRLADKAQARNYIKSKNLEEILIPLYGIYNNADEIDFDKLPNRFVIKLNNGS
ncbi:ATP-grasp fold amidoligase family protein, partial [Salinicoccus roseus]|uniref:ATP-grasp fold amidoligase family protein n=1 Tax=Salinicoccus roseus TaxID=45670 RepID=UPI0039EC19DD